MTLTPRPTLSLALLLACWFSHRLSVGAEPQVPASLVEKWNALGAANRPTNAEAPGRYSVDIEAHRIAYNFQAPGIALVPMPNGGTRMWLCWYQQNNKPGGAAIGGGSISHTVHAFCDDPFSKAEPVWTQVVRVEPIIALGGETASDPEVSQLPDGRLLGIYITSGPGHERKRATYAFIISNPTSTTGAFQLGQQHWLGYGVLSQPFIVKGEALAMIDEWSVARHFCKLEFPATANGDAIHAAPISNIPWPGPKTLTSFFEGSMHIVSGDRFRAYRRTMEGVYTSLSEPGGRAWGADGDGCRSRYRWRWCRLNSGLSRYWQSGCAVQSLIAGGTSKDCEWKNNCRDLHSVGIREMCGERLAPSLSPPVWRAPTRQKVLACIAIRKRSII